MTLCSFPPVHQLLLFISWLTGETLELFFLFTCPTCFLPQMLLTFLKVSYFLTLKPLGACVSARRRGEGGRTSRRAQPAGDARSTGQQGKRPGEWEGCSELSSLPCWGRWERREHTAAARQDSLCSKPRAGEVRPSSPLLLTHPHRSPGLAQDFCSSKRAEERKLHLPRQVHRNNFYNLPSPPPPLQPSASAGGV